jgi:hypothetical protein
MHITHAPSQKIFTSLPDSSPLSSGLPTLIQNIGKMVNPSTEKPSSVYFTHEMAASAPSFITQNLEKCDSNSNVERDPLNPRNWSSSRKTMLFVSLMTSSLLADGYVLSNLPAHTYTVGIVVFSDYIVELWYGVERWSRSRPWIGILASLIRRRV